MQPILVFSIRNTLIDIKTFGKKLSFYDLPIVKDDTTVHDYFPHKEFRIVLYDPRYHCSHQGGHEGSQNKLKSQGDDTQLK